jgi:hypothetical protein
MIRTPADRFPGDSAEVPKFNAKTNANDAVSSTAGAAVADTSGL